MRDLIIIGSGPAGLSAAVYAKRAGIDVLVIEKEPFSGGQIIKTDQVDNYLGMYHTSGYDMAMKFRAHADALSVEFLSGEVMAVRDCGAEKKILLASNEELSARAILIASGARYRNLGIDSEKKYVGAGVSYCATCDGAFFRNKSVAVVGGGNVALGDVIYLAKHCSHVYLIHRRDEFRASKHLVERAMVLDNVEILPFYEVREILGNGMVERLRLNNNQTGVERMLDVSGIFVAVGMEPQTNFLGNVVEKDAHGYVIAKENGVTGTPGFFVAGDARTKEVRQLVTAVSDGANAVASIEKYLQDK
ncbi:MAG: FAD-dependent oxidoreductase [Lachnospiraceae bacterium]|nr:FAD-dependent oxidoreductase [Lachnospiraceae bacterium]